MGILRLYEVLYGLKNKVSLPNPEFCTENSCQKGLHRVYTFLNIFMLLN